MPWFKVDDKLHDHHKTRAAGVEAMGLWALAGSWCADNGTDGFVPETVVSRWSSKSKRLAAQLVEAGYWHPAERKHERGWEFHDWLDFQPSAERVEAERTAARERQRRAREKAASRRDSDRDSARSSGVSHGPPDPTRPDPTQAAAARVATLPTERRRLLDAAAAIIGERAASRPGVQDATAVAKSVAASVIKDRHEDACRYLAAHPTTTPDELAEHLEPTGLLPKLEPANSSAFIPPVEHVLAARPEPDRELGIQRIRAIRDSQLEASDGWCGMTGARGRGQLGVG